MRVARLVFALVLTAGAWSSALAAELRAARANTSEAVFSRPHDLALSPDGRYLYVADLGNDVVRVLDPSSLAVVGEIGKGELSSPHDVAFDLAGRMYVADSGHDRIAVYHVEGASGRKTGELRGTLKSPEGVVPGPNGRVYATSTGGHALTVFIGNTCPGPFGEHGRAPGQYIRPHDIDIGPDGQIYVADPGNNRVQVLNADFEHVRSLEGPGFLFREPKYLGFDERGRLYVADQHNDQIKIFDRALRPLGVIGSGRRGGGADELDRPEGVAARAGQVWIADTYNNRILRYRLSDSAR